MSFAFTVRKSEYVYTEDAETGTEKVLRKILEIDKLYDVSVVDIPAYDATEISARNAFAAESELRKAESIKAASLAREKYNYERIKMEEK